jgi:hypothetical protein
MSDDEPPKTYPKNNFSERDGWVYGGVGTAAFSTVLGAGLFGFYEDHTKLGVVFTLLGTCGLVAMVMLLRGHRLTVIHSAIAALIATWFFFGYLIFEGVGQNDNPPEQVAKAIAPIQSDLDESKKQISSVRSQLEAAIKERDSARQAAAERGAQPSSPEDQIPISWQSNFQLNYYAGQKMAWIRFMGQSTALTHIKDAYIISDLTGHKERLTVANPTNLSERWDIDQIEPIASGAAVSLFYEPKPPPSFSDFLSEWGAFEFHVTYDDKEHPDYVKKYSQIYINEKMVREMPGVVGLRVTKKSSDK